MLPTLSTVSLSSAIRCLENDLAPADIADIAKAVDRLMTFSRTFNITTDRDGLTEIYLIGCKGIPRRALNEGIPKAISQTTDTYRLPQPGAIWDLMREDIAGWEAELKIFLGMVPPEPPPPPPPPPPPETDEFRNETARVTDDTLKLLKATSQRMRIR
jgi:hypothetical protein